MHCPNCGKPADIQQQFCRACGLNLGPVGKHLAEHVATTLPELKAHKSESEQEIVRQMFRWMTWGMILIGIGVLMMVANKSFDLGGPIKFISAVVCLAGVGVAFSGLVKAMNERASLSGKKATDQIPVSVDTKSLPTAPIPASLPSITERTTQLIAPDEAQANNMMDSKRRE